MSQAPLTRQNLGFTIATLTAAATSGASVIQNNLSCKGIVVNVNVASVSGTSPTLVVTIQGIDPASGATYTLLASAAITAAGLTTLTVYPGVPAAANTAASLPVPNQFKVSWTIGGTTPAFTATIGGALIV